MWIEIDRVIGVDLGGTNVRAGAVDASGAFLGDQFVQSSRAQEGLEATLQAIAFVIDRAKLTAKGCPRAVGIAIPGHVDDRRGVVIWAPNFGEYRGEIFECWHEIPIREMLAERVGLPIVIGNDANLAALGEYRFGVGRNRARCLVLLTIGTGIGGGVVLGPEAVLGRASGPLLLIGGNGGGAELGHTVILAGGLDCNAGSYGALEAYCQRDSIVRRAVFKVQRGRASLAQELAGGDLAAITPRHLAQAADQGDEVALDVFREVGTYLGVGIGNFINTFAPDIVAIGGQIAKAGEHLLGPARLAARDVAIPSLFADATITLGERIEDAGILGAAALALEADV